MSLPVSFKEELKRRLSIVDIVGRRVRLTRRGDQATGLCPFHREKSPSFHVYDHGEDAHYHCYGCGAHGDAITFVMETEGLDFPAAIEKLAAEAGLEVPRESPAAREAAERQASLAGVLDLASRFFEAQLGGQAGAAARAYLERRGLDAAAAKRFRLGFAPGDANALKAKLEKENVPEALGIEAGLLKRQEESGRVHDFFRGRLTFPILDARSRVIAFGARALGEEKPKYLNTPETPLFKKSRTLYNIDKAQKAARDRGEIVVVEGYMDAIAMAEAGFPQTVAPLGTAFGEDHLALLWRLAPEPILCFDGDAAGIQAAKRALGRALPILRPGLSLRFAWLPAGLDPDDLLRAEGASRMRDLLDRAQPLVDVLWQMATEGRHLDTPERRAGFRRDLLAEIGRIGDGSIAADYRREMLQRLEARLAPPALRGGPARSFPNRPLRPGPADGGEGARRGTGGIRRLPYELLLAVLWRHPELLSRYSESLALIDIPDPQLDKLKSALLDHAARISEPDRDLLGKSLTDLGFSSLLAEIARRVATTRFAAPEASAEQAELGLRHVFAMLREAELASEVEIAGKVLAENMSEENLTRLEMARQSLFEAESRRRDLDDLDVKW